MQSPTFLATLQATQRVALIVSEENDDAIMVPEVEGSATAKYIVVTDPLDGSSNIDCNVSVGSIFGIYRRETPSAPVTIAEVLRPGAQMICAGYAMYGSSTQLVVAMPGAGTNIFTLDPTIGEFLLTHRNVRIPEKPQKVRPTCCHLLAEVDAHVFVEQSRPRCTCSFSQLLHNSARPMRIHVQIYSLNEGNYASFSVGVRRFIDDCKKGEKPYSLRYVGSAVADIHRTLLYGGIFMYPPTASAPQGKLRLLYECNPMSLIVEEAGGAASTGTGRVLDVVPSKIHQRVPLFLGCKRDVEAVLKYVADEGSAVGGAGAGSSGAATAAP